MGRVVVSKADVVETFVRSSGPGGQNVNKVETCVHLVHTPTGVTVKCQKYRTQFQNRQGAWSMLERVLEQKSQQEILRKRQAYEKERRKNRKKSAAAKARMLDGKRKHALKKQNRKGGRFEE